MLIFNLNIYPSQSPAKKYSRIQPDLQMWTMHQLAIASFWKRFHIWWHNTGARSHSI